MEPGGPSRLDLISKAVSQQVWQSKSSSPKKLPGEEGKRKGDGYQKETEMRNTGRAEVGKG